MKNKLIIDCMIVSVSSIPKEAIRIARATDYNVEFVFNGVTVIVDSGCYECDISNSVRYCVNSGSKKVDLSEGRLLIY